MLLARMQREDRRVSDIRMRTQRLTAALGAAPVDVSVAIVMGALAVLSHLMGVNWAASAEVTISQGAWWTVLTATLAPTSPGSIIVGLVLALTALVAVERTIGGRRLAVALLGGGTAAVVIGVFAEAGIARWSGLESVEDALIIAPTIGITVAVMAATGAAGALWRRRVRIIVVALVVVFALYAGDAASWVRVVAVGIGAVLGRMWFGRPRGSSPWRSSRDERRTLVAGFVALAGLGPLAALLTGGGRGPLAVAVAQFTDVDARLVARCAQSHGPVCDHQAALVLTQGLGPGLLATVPLLLLAVAALGLRTGRRAGWILGMSTASVLAVAAGLAAATGAVAIPGKAAGAVVEGALWAIGSIGIPLSIVITLWLTRRAFAVRIRPAAARRALLVIAGSFLGLAGAYLVVEATMHRSWSGSVSLGQSLTEAWRRFIPPALLYDAGQPPFPHHGPALWVWQWVGVVFWIIALTVLVRLYGATRTDTSPHREPLIAAMRRGDAGTLAWLGTWSGVDHWFSPSGAAVSYRVVGTIALVVSDPVCLPDERPAAVRGFITFAGERGWTPVFYSVHEETTTVLRELGWYDMPVAEETLLRPAEWTMAGKAGEKVRHPVTRLQREGVQAVWTTWADLSARHSARIREISEDWVAERSLPEMGFTLGGVPEMEDPEVALMLALDADGDVLGVTSWLPSWRLGQRWGWTLDVMRRAPNAPNGVMEFLIASAAAQLKADGISVLSLSGAPLVAADPNEENTSSVMDKVLERVAGALEPLYGFGSLFRFKKKFRPEHSTLSMAYADPLQLGAIGIAVVRAYLPLASRRDVMMLARTVFDRSSS